MEFTAAIALQLYINLFTLLRAVRTVGGTYFVLQTTAVQVFTGSATHF